MNIKELYVLDDVYENIEPLHCENVQEFRKEIEKAKVIPFSWKNKYININSTYIISFVI